MYWLWFLNARDYVIPNYAISMRVTTLFQITSIAYDWINLICDKTNMKIIYKSSVSSSIKTSRYTI